MAGEREDDRAGGREVTSGAAESPSDRMSEAEIDFNVMGSFPASDPPSWTLGIRPHKTRQTEFGGDGPSRNNPTHQNERQR